jgi:hypothetical protein
MTVADTTPIKHYDGNDVTVNFPTVFQFQDEGDLVVVLTDANGNDIVQTITTHYTVSGGAGSTGTVAMVTAPATGETLTIYGDEDAEQDHSFPNAEAYQMEDVEDAFDADMRVIKQVVRDIARCVKLDITDQDDPPSVTVLLAAAQAIIDGAFFEKIMEKELVDAATALTVTDNVGFFIIPEELNGFNLTNAHAVVDTASSSGLPTFQLNNTNHSGGARDMLTTKITIDVNEKTSYNAATDPVIDTTKDDVETGNKIRVDCDVKGTGTQGLIIILTFKDPAYI